MSFMFCALLVAAISFSVLPAAGASSPRVLKTFSGTLDPGGITDPPLQWELTRDVDEYLFHYVITGGSDSYDVLYVLIDGTGYWQLMGEGWDYCECPLEAGSHSVTVEAEAEATAPITYEIGFYLVPQPPVDFAGSIPANSNLRSSAFAVNFPNAGTNQVVLEVTGGDYEFFVDDESKGVVSSSTTLDLEFTSGFHWFDIIAGEGDVTWSVQMLGAPKLEVRILDSCPTLNPDSGQSTCVVGAEATASDGSTPAVSYEWTANGGSFNSTTGQWVEWTAPPGVANFTLTVQARADGYVSDTDSTKAYVLPEFPSAAYPLFAALALALGLLARKRKPLPAA